ncbi:hypothetical protein FOA52_004201 [Chlamydomonas sp. UWO 241]|nr:hypothetical protein FOA52_004201 [Chlamydomonas sp. UWO 241]
MGTGLVVGLSVLAGGVVATAGGLLLRGRKSKSPLSRRLASSRHGSSGAGGVMRALTRLITRRPRSFYDELPLVKLSNKRGMEVHVSALGAAITKMVVPDKCGRGADVVLGYKDLETYATGEPVTYFGVVVGRCANRIANGKMTFNGTKHQLTCNNGPNHLHGGDMGLHKRVFDVSLIKGDDYDGATLTYMSPDGEEGYPGNLFISVTYKLRTSLNELECSITATTDAATPVNIAQHSYFNLAGHASGDILCHELTIHGDHYTPVTASLIPTGAIVPVAGTPFDFTKPHAIGGRIEEAGGYDHNYVLFGMGPQARFVVQSNGQASTKPKLAAVLKDPKSGRVMQVSTTAPGMQFYSGNFLDGVAGKGGACYAKHGGLCLETQAFPDSVNQPDFPGVLLQPGEVYRHHIAYKFGLASK